MSDEGWEIPHIRGQGEVVVSTIKGEKLQPSVGKKTSKEKLVEEDDRMLNGAVVPPTQEVFDYSMDLRRRYVALRADKRDKEAMALFDDSDVTGGQWPDRSVIFDYTPYEVLSHVLEHRGWDERDGQIDMVEDIGDGGNLVLNAPVGIGKTLGYLIPCLLNYSQFMVATSTKALQDQIANQEMPRLSNDLYEIYGYRPKWTVLKGKSNYLDEDNYNRLLSLSPLERDVMGWSDETDEMVREEIARLEALNASGEGAGFDSEGLMTKLGYEIWRHLSATSSKSKWVRKTLERAYGESQVIITNSAYVVSVTRVGMENYPYIGFPQAVIFDEAHHLPDIVTESMSCNFDPAAAGSVGEGLKNVVKNIGTGSFEAFNNFLDELSEAADVLEDITEGVEGRNLVKHLAMKLHVRINRMFNEVITESSDPVKGIATELSSEVTDRATDHPYVLRCASDKFLSVSALIEYCTELGLLGLYEAAGKEAEDSHGNTVFAYHMTVDERQDKRGQVFNTVGFAPIYTQRFGEDVKNSWTDTGILSLVNNAIAKNTPDGDPVEEMPFAPWLTGFTEAERQVVLASGTISNGVQVPLGLSDSEYRKMKSPFNPERCRLYIPSSMVPPNDRRWIQEATGEAVELIGKMGGRALILTSSYKNLDEFKSRIMSNFPGVQILCQGDADKNTLIQRFRDDERSILIGTKGFWEGVDVPGPACSLVIVDKIPFPFPSAVVKAREEYIAQTKGKGQVFMGVSVLDASQMVAQAVGRLIRSEGDVGGVAILDSRISSARYGNAVIGLLNPGTKYTHSLEEFKLWLESVNPDEPGSPEDHEFNDRLWASAVPVRKRRRNFG